MVMQVMRSLHIADLSNERNLLVYQMHDQLDEKLQFIIEEHRKAREQPKNARSLMDDKKRAHDFVDVLLDLQEDKNTKEKIEDITIKALILVRIILFMFITQSTFSNTLSPRICI